MHILLLLLPFVIYMNRGRFIKPHYMSPEQLERHSLEMSLMNLSADAAKRLGIDPLDLVLTTRYRNV